MQLGGANSKQKLIELRKLLNPHTAINNTQIINYFDFISVFQIYDFNSDIQIYDFNFGWSFLLHNSIIQSQKQHLITNKP